MTHVTVNTSGGPVVVALDQDTGGFTVTPIEGGGEICGYLKHGLPVSALGKPIAVPPRLLERLREMSMGDAFVSAPARDLAPHHAGGEP